jgi:hypothetical protein
MNLATAPGSATVGTTWTDISGNGNNGTLAGSNSYLTYTSSYGGGITISGAESGTYISTGYNISSNTFTISMAAAINPVSYWATWWGNDVYNSHQGYYAYMPSSSTLNFGSTNGPASYAISGYTSLAIWDFVINGTNVYLYKNGSLLTSSTITAPSGGYATDGLYFGSRHANAGGATNTDNCAGTYYSMRVYNVALNSTQIAQNYAALKGTYGLS